MTFSTFVRFVWILAGITPAQAVIHRWDGARAVLSITVYVLGWAALAIGHRRDPRGERLRTFIVDHRFILTFVFGVTLQVLLLIYPAHWVSFLALTAGAWLLCTWALTDSARTLAVNLARHALIAGSCCLALLAIEGGLWALSLRKPANDGFRYTWGHPIRNNRFGFREREFTSPKPPGVFRVMVLGDSLTWGAGLSEPERYTNLTEANLSRLHPGRRIEVLNFGVSGGPTVLERDILLRHMHDVEPDLIVVGFCINDPQPKRGDYAVEIEQYRVLFRITRSLDSLKLTRTAWFLDALITNALAAQGRIPHWLDALDRTYDKKSPEWQDFRGALAGIRHMSDTHRLPPPLFIPLLYGDGNYARPTRELSYYLRWSRQASREAEAAGLHVLSLEEEFKAEGHRVRRVNAWDDHPGPQCQVVYARKLTDAIAPLLKSPSSAP